MKVADWASHWAAKTGDDELSLNGYRLDGASIDRETYEALFLEPTLRLLELEPTHNVLDVGCGTGMLLRELEPRAARVVGTDLSAEMLARYDGCAQTVCCAADELPFPPESFDRIVMFSVAQYFPDVAYFARVVGGLIRLLRAPGILLVADLPIGAPREGSPYLSYSRRDLCDAIEPYGLPFSLEAQGRAKRRLNTRYDLVVYRD